MDIRLKFQMVNMIGVINNLIFKFYTPVIQNEVPKMQGFGDTLKRHEQRFVLFLVNIGYEVFFTDGSNG